MLQDLPSLRTNFAWTLAGNVIYAACQWGMLIALAKLTNTEMVGQFALGLAITAPVFMFSSLQLRVVQATDAGHEYRFEEYFTLRLICTAAAWVVVLAIDAISGYRASLAALIMVIAFAKGAESISDVLYGLLQQHERLPIIARSMILKGALSLTALATTVYFTRSVLMAAAALAIAWVLVLLGYDIPQALTLVSRQEFRPRWDRRRIWRLTWLTLPMGLVMMLISLNTNIPRYFIEKFVGSSQLGIFAAMAYLMQAGSTIMIAVGNVVSPRLARYYAGGQIGEFRRLLLNFFYVGAALGAVSFLGAYFLGHFILTILYRPEYAQYTSIFTVLMLAAAVSYSGSCFGIGVSALRCFAAQFPIAAISSLVGLVCSYYAVPRMGLMGAAITVLLISTLAVIGYAGLLLLKLSSPRILPE